MLSKNFVRYLFHGTIVSEDRLVDISDCNIDKAWDGAAQFVRRPFAFQFETHSREDHELDSKRTAKSPRYYLGGTILTAAEILAGTDPRQEILRGNVRCNDIKRVLVTGGAHFPLEDDAVVLHG